jgi:hypothetical protein
MPSVTAMIASSAARRKKLEPADDPLEANIRAPKQAAIHRRPSLGAGVDERKRR